MEYARKYVVGNPFQTQWNEYVDCVYIPLIILEKRQLSIEAYYRVDIYVWLWVKGLRVLCNSF